jgi:DNA-directed RNA polymerase specialized sigma24 family protein
MAKGAGPVMARVVRFARAMGASKASAEDVAQTALTKFLGGAWEWDPIANADIALFLMGVARSVIPDERARAGRRYERATDQIDQAGDPAAGAKAAAAVRAAETQRAFARLLERAAGDPRALEVIRLVEEGVDKARAQAARLRCDVREIYDARDRIRRHVERIKQELDAERGEPEEQHGEGGEEQEVAE